MVQSYQKKGASVKNIFLFLFTLLVGFIPTQSRAAPLTLEPYSKEHAIENFHVKEFVDYNADDASLLDSASSHQAAHRVLVFSDEEKATHAASFFKKKNKQATKVLSLKECISSVSKQSSTKDTFLSFRFENANQDANIETALIEFVSLGGVVHIDQVIEHPEGIEYIKSLSKQCLSKDRSIQCVLSGDGVIVYSSNHHPLEISPILAACTESFLESTESENLLKTEKTILSSISAKELEIFDWMEQQTIASKESAPLYPLLWKGLFYLDQKEYFEASRCFHKALASGVDNWRVYWYISLAETERRNYLEAKRALLHVLNEVPEFKEAQELLERIEEV